MLGRERSTRRYRSIRKVLLAAAIAAASLEVPAEDLVQVYRDAQRYDAVYSGARYALEAGREKLPQGRSLLLPTLGLTGSATKSRIDSESRDPATAPNLNFLRRPQVDGYTLTFSQPVFRLQNWYQFEQGEQQLRQAEAAFGQASQDLIVRVSQAYFDVLSAQDTLALARAQKAAISEQLAQAKRNFEVGTATITDTHEAQARYDLIIAQEIAAQNDLENKRRALQLVTGKEYTQLKPLRTEIRLSPPVPNDMQSWVDLAEKQSYPVLIQQAVADVAQLETRRASAGHMPTLDLVGTYGTTRDTGSLQTGVGRDITTSQLSLQLSAPRRELAVAGYSAILNQLRLKAAAGSLREEDLEEVNRALLP